MTSPTLLSLAGRVESLTGPCRETDLAIHLALYPDGKIAQIVASHRRGFDGKIGTAWEIFHTGAVCYETRNKQGHCYSNGGHPLPAVTASLDAAMMLVPEDHWWEVVQTCAPDSAMRNFGSRKGMFTAVVRKFGGDRSQASSDSPAIAFAAAILRARSALEASHG